MDEFRARGVVDSLRDRGVSVHLLRGGVPRIEDSEDFDDSRIVDAIIRTDYDQPVAHQRAVALTPAPALPRGGRRIPAFSRRLPLPVTRPWPTDRARRLPKENGTMTPQQRALITELRAADYPATWKLSASAVDDKLVADATQIRTSAHA